MFSFKHLKTLKKINDLLMTLKGTVTRIPLTVPFHHQRPFSDTRRCTPLHNVAQLPDTHAHTHTCAIAQTPDLVAAYKRTFYQRRIVGPLDAWLAPGPPPGPTNAARGISKSAASGLSQQPPPPGSLRSRAALEPRCISPVPPTGKSTATGVIESLEPPPPRVFLSAAQSQAARDRRKQYAAKRFRTYMQCRKRRACKKY